MSRQQQQTPHGFQFSNQCTPAVDYQRTPTSRQTLSRKFLGNSSQSRAQTVDKSKSRPEELLFLTFYYGIRDLVAL